MDRPRAVFLLTGIMASGKSTVAQLLAERLPRAAHVRGDAFRRMIVTGRRDMTPGAGPEAETQLALRYRLAATAADAYFGAGFSVVVQDVILGGWLPRFVDLLEGRPLLVVVLAPRPEVVEAREANRSKTGYGAWTAEQLDRSMREETPSTGAVDRLLGADPRADGGGDPRARLGRGRRRLSRPRSSRRPQAVRKKRGRGGSEASSWIFIRVR